MVRQSNFSTYLTYGFQKYAIELLSKDRSLWYSIILLKINWHRWIYRNSLIPVMKVMIGFYPPQGITTYAIWNFKALNKYRMVYHIKGRQQVQLRENCTWVGILYRQNVVMYHKKSFFCRMMYAVCKLVRNMQLFDIRWCSVRALATFSRIFKLNGRFETGR